MNSKLVSRRAEPLQAVYFRTLKLQALLVVIGALLCLPFDGVMAYSALVGGGIYLIPNLYVAVRHFRNTGTKSAQAALADLYAGQLWKMSLMAVGFALAFVLIEPISVFSLFVTLIVLQLVHILMQIRVNT